ncbi:MAG: metalloregulator ArsR/SmtB family transcription factor [Planctomycetia bacterium]|nr:metalloregulator ArsR/SmtB family transcription factor [Planctomycetia bacterium]
MSISHRQFKDGVYEQLARIGKAVSAPKRLELLELICQGPRTVEALARLTDLSMANASQHLKVLRSARLIDAEKKGLYVEYRLADESVGRYLLSTQSLADARLAEIRQLTHDFLEQRGALEPVNREELMRRVREGDVIVLDVRPSEEYAAGHIPGAVSVPIGELKSRLKELPKGKEIVAYCRGPYCIMSIEAVELLRKKGFRAQRMEQGVLDWRARGWRIEAGTKKAGR